MSDYLKALELQRLAFEAQFGSIEDLGFEDKSKKIEKQEEEQPESEEDDDDLIDYSSDEVSNSDSDGEENEEVEDFQGFSDTEKTDDRGTQSAVVVKFNETAEVNYKEPSKKELRAIRSGKILTMEQQRLKDERLLKLQLKQQVKDGNDAENLKNDLELQRLLKESHFLSQTKNDFSGAELTMQTINFEDPIGKARKRTLDSRLKLVSEINAHEAHNRLEKMPMSMRKGMINSAKLKIEKYERDARENDVVLSKVKKGQFRDLWNGKGSTSKFDRIGTGQNKQQRIRDRGLKIHSVGKSTKNGLILSSNDLAKITGSSGSSDFKKKKRGRR